MTVDGRKKAEQMEAAIRGLQGVKNAALVLDDADRILEIHVTTSPERSPKRLGRDICTLLLTTFATSIDHRIVSVLPIGRVGSHPGTATPPNAGAASAAAAAAPAGAPVNGPPVTRSADRIRFVSVNLYLTGPRAQAQVELRWKGITRMGNASGAATRDGAHHLVAVATVAALEMFLEEEWSLGVKGVQFVALGDSQAVVVGLTLLAHRREKTLAGCCTVEQDVPQAVALATLAAFNRVAGGLETREPIEYVLRPTSFQEASEARKP